uniref:MMS19 nucleotide excision repair protein n=2 Tax=Rhizophora mucronata TaxID=61149 RepID=A0A2P2MRE0_RHIMU
MLAFSSTPLFEPFAMPLLLEKLSSSLPSAMVDSLKYLSFCTSQYGAERVAKHAGALWSSLRDAICDSVKEHALSFTLELLHGVDTQGNQIEREALSFLEKLIIQNNDLFLGLIIQDQEINMLVNTATSYKSYKEILTQSKQKLYAVGRILYVSAKASIASCNKIFQSFFPRLLMALGLSVESASGMCCSKSNGIICGQANFGPLYLCIELLGACGYLIVDPEDLKSQFVYVNEVWCCWLQHSPLP